MKRIFSHSVLAPFLIMIIVGLFSAGILKYFLSLAEQKVEQEAIHDLVYYGEVVRGTVNSIKHNKEGLQALITSLASTPNMISSFLMDNRGKVIFAAYAERVGRAAKEIIPQLQQDISHSAAIPTPENIRLRADGQSIVAIYPVGTDSLVVEKNLLDQKLAMQNMIKQLIGIFALFAIILIGLLWLIMRGLIAHRVKELTAFIRYIDSIDKDIYEMPASHDGFTALVYAITDMAKKFDDKHKLLVLNETRLSNSQRIAKIATWEWNIKTDTIYCSEVIKQISDRIPRDKAFSYGDFLNIVDPQDRTLVEEGIKKCMLTGEHYDLRHRIVQSDGTIRWIHAQGDLLQNHKGEPIHIHGVVQDITEHYEYQNKLLNANRDLYLIEHAMEEHIIMAVTNSEGIITRVNEKFCHTTQYRCDELVGQHLKIIKSDHHSAEFYANLMQRVKDGETWHGELCNRRKNGELYWTKATIVPHIDKDGKIDSYINLHTDITAQKQVQHILYSKNEFLDAILEHTKDGIIVCNAMQMPN